MHKFKSISSWFKAHRKMMIIHGSILSGFLLYCFFLAGPVFDRFERMEGEARLQNISLPIETNNIANNLDRFDVRTNVMDVEGWAYIEGQSAEDSKIYVVLKSDTKTYVFDTLLYKRAGVTAAFPQLNLNLDDSGFVAFISPEKIATGEYVVGIYIRKGDIEALQYTDKIVENPAKGLS